MHVWKKPLGNLFFPCTIWAPGIEFKSSGLVATDFTHGAMLLAQVRLFIQVLGTKLRSLCSKQFTDDPSPQLLYFSSRKRNKTN